MRLGFGVDLVVDQQARRLVELGHDVIVVVIHADLVQPSRSYKLVVINKVMHAPDFNSAASVRRILSRANITDVDLWMLHTPPFYDWARWLDGPVVLTEYGAPPGHFFEPQMGRQIDAGVKNRLERLYSALQPFDAIVSISRSIHEWLPRTVQGFSTVIHLGADHFPQVGRGEAESLRSSLGVSPDQCLVLWVGRMQLENDEQPYKGFPELLSIMPLIQHHVPHAKFLLVGRTSDNDRRRIVEQGVAVLANQTSMEMARAYAAADVLLNLSKWEGFNLALLEAQFQGTPAVAYDFGPHPEIVRHNETGLLAKSPQEMFNAVINIATDTDFRRRLSEQARTFARTFTWEKNVIELLPVIEACVARSPSRAEIARLRETAIAAEAARAAGQPVKDAAEPVRRWSIPGLPQLRGPAAGAIHRWTRRAAAPLGRADQSSPWFTLQDDVFVQHAYRVLLGREAVPPEVEGWVARLRGGEKRRNVLAEIRFSAEGKHRPVEDPELRRLLSDEERASQLGAATWAKRFARTFRRSEEAPPVSEWFLLNDDAFVREAYQILLGREAEPSAIDGWAARLRAGESRLSILANIRCSDEGKDRPLLHPELRRILSPETLRRLAVDRTLSVSAPAERPQREKSVESGINAPVADVGQIGPILDRLAATDARLDERDLSWTGPTAASRFVNASGLRAAGQRLTHVLLVAPGAVLEATAAQLLAQAAQSTESDIVFGDEFERSIEGTRRLLIHGPFSHAAFLHAPDIGGVVAVHSALLSRLELPPTVILTGRIVLQLIAYAHRLTYLPATLCERASDDIAANRPTKAEMIAYLGRIGREATVVDGDPDGKRATFDIRYPIKRRWKAAVVVVPREPSDEHGQWLTAIEAVSPRDRFHLILAGTGNLGRHARGKSSKDRQHTSLGFSPATSYGRIVNEAVRQAPADCNLVVVMDGGVVPTAPDWLERLAESALRAETGVVAPKTLYQDGRIRHAGMVLGLGEACGYVLRFARPGAPRGELLVSDRLSGLREVSVASRHCMMVRRAVFSEQGGFDEELGIDAVDIDFCLRLRNLGLSVLLDGRVVMTSFDETPRWGRNQSAADALTLLSRHRSWLVEPDAFWILRRAADDTESTGLRTTVIPPIESR